MVPTQRSSQNRENGQLSVVLAFFVATLQKRHMRIPSKERPMPHKWDQRDETVAAANCPVVLRQSLSAANVRGCMQCSENVGQRISNQVVLYVRSNPAKENPR
jgi:carbamoylphosphate synthase large subunit